MEYYARRVALLTLLLGSIITCVQADVYDYVIAGAGTAGLVIANRLSENPKVTVAVVEPGPDVRHDPAVQSLDFSFFDFNASINWQYTSVPQPSIGGRTYSYRAGKTVGGTSSVNGMIYIRGDKAQYDAWEELGNKGWNWDTVFPYAKRGEGFVVPSGAQRKAGATYDAAAHGDKGPVTVSFPYALSNGSFYSVASETWKKLGLQATKDVNGGRMHGFCLAPSTLDRDAMNRDSSARAYYEPVDSRKNLKLIRGTVKRIVWAAGAGKDAVADGFEYVDSSGRLVTVKAKKEVILSASAYRNPLILEGSGVGNPKILKKLGVKVKVSLPGVGESLQDHNVMASSYATTTNIEGTTPFATMPTAQDVFGNQTDAIAKSTRGKLAAWAKTASQACDGAISARAFEKRFRVQHDLIFRKNVTIAETFPSGSAGAIFAQYWTSMPFSWGSVHLGAADRLDEPVIDARMMLLDFDADMLAAVGRLSQKAYRTPPLRDLVADADANGLPADATEAQWAKHVRENVFNTLHVVGTCAMLPQDLGGVVDPKLKVYGTKNVRVVDASVIPMQLTGHTMAPVYGVAERAADLIKGGGK